jgi:hypothetical protein
MSIWSSIGFPFGAFAAAGSRRFFRGRFGTLGSQLAGVFDKLGKRVASIPLEPNYTTDKALDDVQSSAVGSDRQRPSRAHLAKLM